MKRGSNKIQIDFSAPDIYKHYVDTTGNPKKLSQKQYTTITKEFFETVTDMMIFDNIEFTFPKRLGNIRILKYKTKIKLNSEGKLDKRVLRPDWGKTRKLWKKEYPDKTWEEIVQIKNKPVVFHENKHTEGFSHMWKWDRTTCNVPNYVAYSLEISRHNDRKLAKALKNEDNELDFYTCER